MSVRWYQLILWKNSLGASSKSLARIVTVTEVWLHLCSTPSLLSGGQSPASRIFFPPQVWNILQLSHLLLKRKLCTMLNCFSIKAVCPFQLSKLSCYFKLWWTSLVLRNRRYPVKVLQVVSWTKFLLMTLQRQCGSTVVVILICNFSLLL